jgi:hypothetical protein
VKGHNYLTLTAYREDGVAASMSGRSLVWFDGAKTWAATGSIGMVQVTCLSASRRGALQRWARAVKLLSAA